MRRTPCIVVIEPRIRPRLDGDKTVHSVFVGQCAPGTGEIRIERRGMLVDRMSVPARRVRLPQLNQRARNRLAIAIQHPPGHDDALAERLARMLTGEIVVGFANLSMTVNRPGYLRQSVREKNQWLRGCTPHRSPVGLAKRTRLATRLVPAIRRNNRSLVSRKAQRPLLEQCKL